MVNRYQGNRKIIFQRGQDSWDYNCKITVTGGKIPTPMTNQFKMFPHF